MSKTGEKRHHDALYDGERKSTIINAAPYVLERMLKDGYEVVREWETLRPGVRQRHVKIVDDTIDRTLRQVVYFCQDCGDNLTFGNDFMARDDLWKQVCGSGIICLSCFEGRLGRRLTFHDLKDCGLKRMIARWR